VVAGLAVRDDGEEIVLVDSTGREVRVPTMDIEEASRVPISPIPAGLADLLGDDGLLNLLACLRRGTVSVVR